MSPKAPSPYRHRARPDAAAPRPAWLRLVAMWFGMRSPVSARAYAISGVLLMLLKYALDASLVFAVTHRFWSPLSYLVPSAFLRGKDFGDAAPAGLFAALGVMTLPFVWIGVTMSVRRAANAGLSPWVGLVFLVPLLNYAAMIVLAVLPAKAAPAWEEAPPSSVPIDPGVKRALLAVVINVVQTLGMTALA